MPELLMFDEEMQRLKAKVDRLSKALDEAKRQLEAFETVQQCLEPKPVVKRRHRAISINGTVDELRGKTLLESLVHIAEMNEGNLNTRAARPLLVDADVIGPGQSGSNRIWKVVNESERFENIRRGEYRLIDEFNHEETHPWDDE